MTADVTALDSQGFWAVVETFEGDYLCARFADVTLSPLPRARWQGPARFLA